VRYKSTVLNELAALTDSTREKITLIYADSVLKSTCLELFSVGELFELLGEMVPVHIEPRVVFVEKFPATDVFQIYC